MPEIAIPMLLLDHIEPTEPANSLLGGLELLLWNPLCFSVLKNAFVFRCAEENGLFSRALTPTDIPVPPHTHPG